MKYICSYLIIFIDMEPTMFLFAKKRDIFAILANELVNNVVQVNTKCIYIFTIKKKWGRFINNIKFVLPTSVKT